MFNWIKSECTTLNDNAEISEAEENVCSRTIHTTNTQVLCHLSGFNFYSNEPHATIAIELYIQVLSLIHI